MIADIAPLRPDHALFLDFDGTLAPLQDNADAVMLPPDGEAILAGLRARLDDAVAIISGRDIRDLVVRVPVDHWRIGGHGLDVCAPGDAPRENQRQAPTALREALASLTKKFPGVRIEDKGAVLALHYRMTPGAGPALARAVGSVIEATSGYVMQHGKMVIEAKPAAASKGAALYARMQEPPFAGRTPVMVGDDVTDEDAFAEALRMGGEAVKVGEGKTAANARLRDPGAVWRWLKSSVDA